jgi:hypothetical protein
VKLQKIVKKAWALMGHTQARNYQLIFFLREWGFIYLAKMIGFLNKYALTQILFCCYLDIILLRFICYNRDVISGDTYRKTKHVITLYKEN